MSSQITMDLSTPSPPAELNPPEKALWWLKKGSLALGPEWEQAHEICQASEGETVHDWIHGLCHLIEGDHGNAAYWFRRAGKSSAGRDAAAIWDEIAASL